MLRLITVICGIVASALSFAAIVGFFRFVSLTSKWIQSEWGWRDFDANTLAFIASGFAACVLIATAVIGLAIVGPFSGRSDEGPGDDEADKHDQQCDCHECVP